jgi:hypothetical protein
MLGEQRGKTVRRECIDFERCRECDRITTQQLDNGAYVRVCSTYAKPSAWWRRGGCPFANAWRVADVKSKVRAGQYTSKKGRFLI